jgi:hypothetical protein
MRYVIIALGLACLLTVPGANVAHSEDRAKTDGFVPLDLKGWVGLKEFWRVEGGALIGESEKRLNFNTFLCSQKAYRDFELSFQVRLRGGQGNSGVQIRSALFDLEHYAVMGPQCDMGQIYWGSLYGEHFGGMMKQAPKEIVTRVLKADDFNDYSIRCVGKHVTIKLNGETTVDADFPTLPERGLICWQLHAGPPMQVTFKNIKFKDLSK